METSAALTKKNIETSVKTKWMIDPAHSEIQFKTKHLLISTVTGKFEKFNATVLTDGENFTDARIEFSADVSSINTGVPDRDTHLKSPDFFDAINFPFLTFRSTGLKMKNDEEFVLTGDITIRGTTRPVTLEGVFGGVITDPWGTLKADFELNGKINRKEFGLHWNAMTEAGSLVVAEEVRMIMNVELAKI